MTRVYPMLNRRLAVVQTDNHKGKCNWLYRWIVFDSILSPTSNYLQFPISPSSKEPARRAHLLWVALAASPRITCLGARFVVHHPSCLASYAVTHARKILIQEAPVICCHNHVSRCDSWATPLSGQAPHARANSLGLLILLLLLPPHNHLWLGGPTWSYPRHHSSIITRIQKKVLTLSNYSYYFYFYI